MLGEEHARDAVAIMCSDRAVGPVELGANRRSSAFVAWQGAGVDSVAVRTAAHTAIARGEIADMLARLGGRSRVRSICRLKGSGKACTVTRAPLPIPRR